MSEDVSRPSKGKDFIREIIEDDIAKGKIRRGEIVTRFPPEPNGYLHIGHAKAICLDFGVAMEYGGRCHLRFDDTNPAKEDEEYVQAIIEDVRWLGFDWGPHCYWASDYFERMYECALELIRAGKAYVDDQSAEEISRTRGTLTEPGIESPWRNRSVEENLELFQRMRNGEFPAGSRVLRAKIDMAHPNLNMRDPVMYRIIYKSHHRTGDRWCIYPTYDWAHGLEDSFEGVTHSLCTLEFENHRLLYDWFLDQLPHLHHPRQIEFARLNLTYTVMSKRKLQILVEEKYVNGWDDPRLPTLRGLRRRGYTPEAIRSFCEEIGITKYNSLTDMGLLEHHIREDLNKRAIRRMGVINPLKVVLTNYPEGQVEYVDAVNNPEDPSAGTRKVPFSRELYIEQEDFMENPPPKYYRLTPGGEVRLRYSYIIRCEKVVKNDKGEILELHCTYDPQTRGGKSPEGKKILGTIQWVSIPHAEKVELRIYDRLFTVERPDADPNRDFREFINPDSLKVCEAYVEPGLGLLPPETRLQLERIAYFVTDRCDHQPNHPVLNQIVLLKDRWQKKIKALLTEEKTKEKVEEKKLEESITKKKQDSFIEIQDVGKIKMKVGKVLSAQRLEGTEKLLKLSVDWGEGPQPVVAGIAQFYEPDSLINRYVVVVTNLKPAIIHGQESRGMILGAKSGKKAFRLLIPDGDECNLGADIG